MAGYARTALWAVLITVAGAGAARAQDTADAGGVPELVTDRPNFTEGSDVVGRGVLQVETGLTFADDTEDGVETRDLATPQALVRMGLARRFELRLGGVGFFSESVTGPAGTTRVSGRSDFEVSGKYVLREGSGLALAVVPILSLPIGSDEVGSGAMDPAVKFTWGTRLPHEFELSGNFNFASVTEDRERVFERAVSLSLERSLAPAWGAFWEGFGFFREAQAGCDCTLDTGITRAIGPNAQLDLEIGRGVTASAPDWFVGFGVSLRRLGPARH